MADGPELEPVLREVLAGLAGPAQRFRLVALPVLAVVETLVVAVDPDPWRVVVALVQWFGVALLAAWSWGWWRAGRAGRTTFAVNLVAMTWFQLGIVAITGGLRSPLLPVLPVVAFHVSLMMGPGPARSAVLAGHAVGVLAFAALEASGVSLTLRGHGADQDPVSVSLTAVGLLLVVGVASAIGLRVRTVVARMLARAVAASENERRAHQEHARELTSLSAEIAHELKNPLASVTGLSALLARDARGRDAERLAVLRAEVDRMRETLDAFLDFSRPIGPLQLAAVDLAVLAAEVAALHEGVARARGVRLGVSGAATVDADRRKLRQVLVNLVQNALDAAPSGSAVELVVADEPPSVAVEDRGPGVSAELRDLLFRPGATDKAHGSGLGLVIARALARQHGGEVTLEARPGGGTRAVLMLTGSTQPQGADGRGG